MAVGVELEAMALAVVVNVIGHRSFSLHICALSLTFG
jgi:hypothetical protein